MARDYSKGKVYMIRSKDEDCVPYVGSTTKQYLSQRMEKHRNGYKNWKKGKDHFISSYILFEKYGVENCFIELIELFPCKISEELRKKEREWFDKLNCVNMDKPFRTEEEITKRGNIYYEKNKKIILEKQKIYGQEHKEQIVERNKIWRDKNKEQIAEKNKEFYEKNKEIRLENQKIYREKNKEQILEKAKEKYECKCGSIYRKGNKLQHEQSKNHQNYLSTIGALCIAAVT